MVFNRVVASDGNAEGEIVGAVGVAEALVLCDDEALCVAVTSLVLRIAQRGQTNALTRTMTIIAAIAHRTVNSMRRDFAD